MSNVLSQAVTNWPQNYVTRTVERYTRHQTQLCNSSNEVHNKECLSWFHTFAVLWMLYSFFWVIPWRLNFLSRLFGTFYSAFIGGVILPVHKTYEYGTDRVIRKATNAPHYCKNASLSLLFLHWNHFIKFFNPLQTKPRPLYLKTPSVPRCKHFSSRL